ncbi:MAG: hypothetical protein Q6373_005740 [Candidatus Sigynarchaeota archaeon]
MGGIMKFFLLFDTTPLSPEAPLKALTSQGSRLDVACRMIRACVLGPDGNPSGHSVSAWFASGGNQSPAAALHVDGRVVSAPVVLARFHSELVLARYLKELIKSTLRGTGEHNAPGITLQLLDTATDAASAFLESIKLEKELAGRKVVLLLERGTPVLDASHPGILVFKNMQDDGTAIIVGDHHGFPARVEEKLLDICDHVAAINAAGRTDKLRREISYLGSHAIEFLQLFNHQSIRRG